MQPFVLYNSEQRKKVEFVPRKEGQIDMYVCGMTVYDYCHIGVMVAFDYIIRFLRSQGWKVRYIRNITDILTKLLRVPMKMVKASNNSQHVLLMQ
jgi:cysteinyl-tRNA synthetase